MKLHLLLARLLLAASLLGLVGCVGTPKSTRNAAPKERTFALAVTVNGILQPTPAQFAAIQAKAVQKFAPYGYTIVTDLSLAEQILRVDFVPNPNDPENSGRVNILGFRSNPLYATARGNLNYPYPTAFGYAGSYSNTSWSALNQFGFGYYGYGNSYYDGYSYSSPTLNPVNPNPTAKPTHPPFRHHPPHCAPEPTRHRPAPIEFATLPAIRTDHGATVVTTTTYAAVRSATGDRLTPAFTSTWRGERPDYGTRSGDRTYARSDTGNYRSGSSYSRSDSSSYHSGSATLYSGSTVSNSYTSPSPSYSSSRSESSSLYSGGSISNSYTSPSPSYSSSSSSSSSYSAPSSSSSSGGGGSSGTQEGSSNQKQN